MHILVRSIVLHEDLPNDFNEAGVSKTLSFMNPVMMYLEDFMSPDNYYRISAVVLRDGRFVFGECPPDEVRAIADLPQSERWDAVLVYAKEVAVQVLNDNLALHSVSVSVDDNVSRLLREAIARCSDTAPSYHIRTLGIILDAVEDCEQYPFSRTIDAFLDWPLVDVTEYQEEDLDYGQEAIFIVDLHV
jgi:hypothetical protein